ncbi:phenylalanine--tRNA ligase subunit beta [Thauera sp. CAU 1555]|uniref:Phenylalanine--tRNA ligase beta subunit n=1 Tax=Thauera sedimentorum TaxID=2767595 RepID=A0ABR9B6W9_9RHOO|nr:phenylalanine--tRNA ligase subunit beta [Thauera sedimentorum]MBC9070730.1 phenylalanine--tRNA ligase subunit beta [Thauera sedimentorum]MBD8501649.1 phenylalanine--tRNA ligase subunit beta [Thauera sedimentorum]
MQFSEKWLRSLVNPPLDSDALGHLLTMAGLEVEEADPVAPPFTSVVVARIVETEKHPNADKLKVCKVDAGKGELLQIVCGAPNAAAGMLVPCATVGAVLPGDFAIKAAKLRGVESFGMLCSARELGLSEDHGGLLELPMDLPVGQDIRTALALDDIRFTIKLTPNRSDCLSLAGVGREVAALTGTALALPAAEAVAPTIDARRAIVLDAPEACPRYCGRIIRGVDAKAPTPEWMKQRLQHSGVRAISVLVDITNYVMLELGQPLHAFDNARLDGSVHVRYPQPGEQVLLLNEQTVTPSADTLLIADEARALALAGIMGGEESGITLDTTEVFLESAFFAPDAIAGRARSYGFSSDASHRFERGVDFELPRLAMERATRLILDICGGEAGPVEEAVSPQHLPTRPAVRLRPARVRKLLGIDLGDEAIAALLERVHLAVHREGADFLVTPPSFRFDIEIEEDLVEEIARLHGYDNIPAVAPQGTLLMLDRSESGRSAWDVRHLIAARDYQEVVNYAFVDAAWERDFCANPDPIRLANPIASQMGVMRSSLIPGLAANVVTNRNRQQDRVRVFEIGRCFERKADGEPVSGFRQPLIVAALAAGPAQREQWGAAARNVDFYDVKGDLEALFAPASLGFERLSHPALHPGRAATVLFEGRRIGIIGEIHPVWVQRYDLGPAPVVFEVELEAALAASLPAYREISRQPAVVRDLALVVGQELPVASVLAVLREAAPAIVCDIGLFDVYHGKGIEPEKKSLAFRVLMQDTHRTLEEAEVEQAVESLVRHAEAKLGARLRG